MTTTLTLWTHLFSMITILTMTTIPLQLHGHLQWSTLIMLIPISHPARLVTHHSTIGYTTLCTVLGSQISSGHAFPCNITFILRLGGVTCPYTTTQIFQNTWSTVSPWVIPWVTRQFPAPWIIHLHCVTPHMSITTSQRSPMPMPFVVPSPILHSNLRFKLTHWWQHPRNTLKCVESSWTYPTLKVPLLITAYLEIHIWVCHTNSTCPAPRTYGA